MSVNQTYIQRTINPGESITTNARLHWIGYVSGMLLPLLGWARNLLCADHRCAALGQMGDVDEPDLERRSSLSRAYRAGNIGNCYHGRLSSDRQLWPCY